MNFKQVIAIILALFLILSISFATDETFIVTGKILKNGKPVKALIGFPKVMGKAGNWVSLTDSQGIFHIYAKDGLTQLDDSIIQIFSIIKNQIGTQNALGLNEHLKINNTNGKKDVTIDLKTIEITDSKKVSSDDGKDFRQKVEAFEVFEIIKKEEKSETQKTEIISESLGATLLIKEITATGRPPQRATNYSNGQKYLLARQAAIIILEVNLAKENKTLSSCPVVEGKWNESKEEYTATCKNKKE